jgi:hypothetical protein
MADYEVRAADGLIGCNRLCVHVLLRTYVVDVVVFLRTTVHTRVPLRLWGPSVGRRESRLAQFLDGLEDGVRSTSVGDKSEFYAYSVGL